MSIQNLTTNGIELLKGQIIANGLVLQVLETNPEPQEMRDKTKIYDVVLSDGFAKLKVMMINIPYQLLVNQINKPILNVTNWVTTTRQTGVLTVVKAAQIVMLDISRMIGAPMEWDTFVINNKINVQGSNEIPQTGIKVKIGARKPTSDNKQPTHLQIKNKQSIQPVMTTTQFNPNTQSQPIKSLYPGMSDWAITGRVINKTPLQQFKNGNGHLFNIDIMDKDKLTIQGTFFNDIATKFHDHIEIGKVYMFQKGSIKLNRYSSGANKNPHQITFENYSRIDLLDDTSIADIALEPIPIEQVQQNKHVNDVVDILGVVQDIQDLAEIKSKSGDMLIKRSFSIYDKTGLVTVTFWGNQAKALDVRVGELVGVSGLRVNMFQDLKSLNSTASTTVQNDEQTLSQIPTFPEIKSWYLENKDNIRFERPQQINGQTNNLRLISEIEAEANENSQNIQYQKWSEIRAIVIGINTKSTHYYPSCGDCKKKLEQRESGYYCNSCSKPQTPAWKYILTVKLVDSSGSFWATFQDESAQTLVRIPCSQYQSSDEQTRSKIFGESLYKELRYLLLTKIEEYNGNSKAKHTVIRILANDWAAEANSQFTQLNALLTQ